MEDVCFLQDEQEHLLKSVSGSFFVKQQYLEMNFQHGVVPWAPSDGDKAKTSKQYLTEGWTWLVQD